MILLPQLALATAYGRFKTLNLNAHEQHSLTNLNVSNSHGNELAAAA